MVQIVVILLPRFWHGVVILLPCYCERLELSWNCHDWRSSYAIMSSLIMICVWLRWMLS